MKNKKFLFLFTLLILAGCDTGIRFNIFKQETAQVVASLKIGETQTIGSCVFNSTDTIVNTNNFSYILTFSENVNAALINSQLITNSGTAVVDSSDWSVQDCGDGRTFKIESLSITSDGTIIPDVTNLVAALTSTNKQIQLEADPVQLEIDYDTLSPSVQINQSTMESIGNCSFSGTNDPTNILGFSYKVAFSEKINVSSFNVSDITNIGTGGSSGLTWILENCGDDRNFKLTASSVTGDGSIIPIIMAGRVMDVAGNLNTISMSLDNSITYDTASLLVNINQAITETIGACSFTAVADPSNTLGFAYKILFSKNINPATFSLSDIANSGTSGVATWTLESCGDNRTFKLITNTVAHNGTVVPEIDAGSVEDSLGNLNAHSTGADNSVVYDSIAPSVSINQSITETIGSCSFNVTSDPTNAPGFSYKVIFSENIQVSSFTAGDIVNNGTSGLVAWNLESCGNNQVFKLTASSILSSGTIIPVVSAGSVSDLAGNTNALSTSTDNSVTYDTVVPTVTINQAIAQTVGSCSFSATADPINVAGFSYRVTFSKTINSSTFVVGDINNGGTGGTTALSWNLENCGDDQNFKLTATSITGQGTIVPTLQAGRVSDVAGNTNLLSTSTDNSVTYDTISPSVTINQAIAETIGSCSFSATTDPSNVSGFSYRLIFSEAINASTLDISDVVNSGTGGSSSLIWSISNCGDNRNFKLTASSISGIGTIIPEIQVASVSDLAGNTNSASTSTDNSVTFDNVAPSVTINQATTETVGSCSFNATTDPTSLTGFSYKIIFSEEIQLASFTAGDIVNNGTSGLVVWNLEHCENSRVFKLTANSIIMDGTVVPVVSANGVNDLAGNLNTISTSTDNSVTYDSTKPTVSINQAIAETVGSCTFTAANDPTNTAGFSYRITFGEVIDNSSFTISDVTNIGTGGASTLTWALEDCGDNQNYKLAVSAVNGDGTIIPSIPADRVYDMSGNQNLLSTATDNSITIDTNRPSVTINQATTQTVGTCSFSAVADPTNTAGFSYRVTFSEAINASTFLVGDIINSGTGGATTLSWALDSCGDNLNFKLSANLIAGDGTIIPSVAANGVSDLAGNLNTVSTSTDNSVTYDTTGPAIVISRSVLETIGSCSFTNTGTVEGQAGFSFKVSFSEKINPATFTTSDVTNSGTGGATTLTWALANCGDDEHYKLTVSAISGVGTVTPQILAARLTDVLGNQNSLSTSSNGTVSYELLGWSQEAYIKAVNNSAGDFFGNSVSVSGDTLAVGSHQEDSSATTITNGTGFSEPGTSTDSGAVYVYKRTGNTWAQEAYIKAVNNEAYDLFGASVSISGDTLAVGAYQEDSVATTITNGTGVTDSGNSFNSGAVYVYKRTGSTWAQEAYIKAVNNGFSDYFGYTVFLSGNTLGVGVYSEDSNSTVVTNGTGYAETSAIGDSGAVYIYRRTGNNWAQEAYVKASNSGSGDNFGRNISISGDTLAVGAIYEDSSALTITNGTNFSELGTSSDSGAVYIYKRTGNNWQQEAYVKAVNNSAFDYFGYSVSLSGDTLAVGAYSEDSSATTITNGTGFSEPGTTSNSGAVYVYKRTGNIWAQEAYIKAVNSGSSDQFGNSIALSGDTLAVGAFLEDSSATTITNGTGFSEPGSSNDSGAVYVYKRTGNNWAPEAYIKAVNNGSTDYFGFNLSISGDTIAVGAYSEDSSATTITNGTGASDPGTNTNSGAVYVYRSNARVFNTSDAFTTNVLSNSITLNWIQSGFKTTGYKIAYAIGANAPIDCNSGTVIDVGNNTSYTINSLTAGTYYSFRICSYDSGGTLSSGYVVSFPTASAIPEPGDLAAVTNSDRAVTVSWASAGGSVTGYKIAYQSGTTPPSTCNSGTIIDVGNVLTYQITGLLTNTEYGVRVCSYDNSSNLSHGKYISIKTNLALNPTNVYMTSTAVGNNALTVNWTNASDRVTGFIVAWTAGTSAPGTCSTGTVVDVGNVSSYTISGLTAGATYSVRVCGYEAGNTNTSTGIAFRGNVRDTGWVQEAYIKAVNNSAGDYFGYYLFLNGDTLAVTSYLEDSSATTITNGTGFSEPGTSADSGAAYVYKRTGSTWVQEAYIKAVNNGSTDYFGTSVSLSGDTLAVGSYQEDSGATTITNGPGFDEGAGKSNSGAVYVYKRTGNTWAQQAFVKASNVDIGDAFGRSVSLSGDTLAVGADLEDSNSTVVTNGTGFLDALSSSNSGAVYIYRRTGNNWAQEAFVKASNNGSGDSFGINISLSGDTLAVGAYYEDSSATTITNGTGFSDPGISSDSGAVYIYKRTINHWQQEAYIKAVNSSAYDYFGNSVSLSGNTLAVGAYTEDSNATTITNGTGFSEPGTSSDSGAVYVYKRTGNTWAQEAYIKAVNNGSSDQFGRTVSLSGDTLAVGAFLEDSTATTITNGTGFSEPGTISNSGAVYVYKRTGSSWAQEAYIKALYASDTDYFGYNVSLSGDTLAVGVFYEDSSATTITNGTSALYDTLSINSGAVYVYRNNNRLFNTQDAFTTNVLSNSITLNWIQSGFKTTGYKIAYAIGANAPIDCNSGTVIDVGNNTSYTINSLTAGTYYSFRICSYDSGGTLSSGYVVSFPTASAIPEPGDLTAVANSDRAVTVSWASAGGSVTGYKIAYQSGTTPPSTCNSGTVIDVGNVLTYQITGLLTNTEYGVRVCSYDNSSNLSHGKYISTKTNLALNPTNLYATSTAVGNNTLTLYWTNASDRVTGFIVAWAAGTTAPATCSTGTIVNVGNVSSYTISGLTAGVTYSVRVCGYEAGNTNTSTGSSVRGNVRDTGWVQEAYIKAVNSSAGDYFGSSISISGETLAVGAYYEDSGATTITNGIGFSELSTLADSGAVYVYKRTGNNWAQEAYIKAVNNGYNDYFGYSVSLSGDTLAVGSFQEDSAATTITNGTGVSDTGTSTNSGAVYVYKRTGNNWAQEAYIKAVNNGFNDYFGRSVSVYGDTLAVGAYAEDSSATTITNGTSFSDPGTSNDSGAVYVYKRTGNNWAQEAYVKASNNGVTDYFGHNVVIHENTMVVTAHLEDSSATTITNGTGFSDPGISSDSGAVYVYKRTGNTWAQEAYIKAVNNGSSDNFGNSVSLSGDTLIVGAYLEDSAATTITNGTGVNDTGSSINSGAVYVYKRTGNNWAQEAYIKAGNNLSSGDFFGNSVSLSGNTLVVGAPREDSAITTITNAATIVDNSSGNDNGSAYIYKRSGAIWQQEAYVKSVNNTSGDEFGTAVSISGDTIAISAIKEDSISTTISNGTGIELLPVVTYDFGAVYIYRNNARLFDITEVFPTVTSNSIYLKWNKTGGTAIGYGVNYEVGLVTPPLCSTTMDYDLGNVNDFLLNSLTSDTNYTFRLCVYDNLNNFIEDKIITLKTLP